ncbi:hypothetical protein RhiirC2_787775 [Rhizophagus irregularis]|uniref:TLDc domain-containing protein n=1 Tax=Rhizophagus irregularis TaxID=588596 RepID=A0A2N1MRI8_9GLOM|nr:hypothetical protein RhiirC2_787775 [Rhizophagus irregularis]
MDPNENEMNNVAQYLDSLVTMINPVEDSNEILGGYNPITWKTDCSFVKDEEFAIFNYASRSLGFSHDLVLYGNKCGNTTFNPLRYEKSIRKINGRFNVEEYEIFQITKGNEPKEIMKGNEPKEIVKGNEPKETMKRNEPKEIVKGNEPKEDSNCNIS